MQSKHTLAVTRRERTGSRYARREREAGRLPAVLYGHGEDPVALSLNAKEAIRFFEEGERVFDIELKEENATQTVLLKDIQFDYLGTNVIHVDLTRVDLNEEVESTVQIEHRGEPKGLKTAGAMMTTPITSVEIRCTVASLPDHLDAHVEDLGVGDVLTARDLTMPEGVELLTDPDSVLVRVFVKQEEEEAPEGEAETVESESAEPERIGEKDKGEASEKEGEG